MKFSRTFIMILVAFCGFNQQQLCAQKADLVLMGGKKFTSWNSSFYAEAIAIENNIIAVGTNVSFTNFPQQGYFCFTFARWNAQPDQRYFQHNNHAGIPEKKYHQGRSGNSVYKIKPLRGAC